MMILVSISRRSGMFQYVAIWSAQKAHAHPAGILLLLQITTAVLSSLLDNVTTVLLIVPVTLAIAKSSMYRLILSCLPRSSPRISAAPLH